MVTTRHEAVSFNWLGQQMLTCCTPIQQSHY